jgi:magnesium transporter
MIRSLFYNAEGSIQQDLTLDQITAILKQSQGVLWVDLVEEDLQISEHILKDIFGFHPLAVSDALDEQHVPRVDDWSTYLYLVLHAPFIDTDSSEPLKTFELDVFLSKNYLVTYQAKRLSIVDRVWKTILRDDRYLKQGADHLFYKLADDLVADFMPLAENLDVIIDEIEDRIFSGTSQVLLAKIFVMKRSILQLRRIIAPLREVFNKLARGDDTIIDKKERVFFRDIYDHLVRLHDISESLRDLMSSILDTYLSVINNRMNEVMKTLTVITTLFMPLSFLVGFFGMNFFAPKVPRTGWMEQPVFFLVLAVCLLLPVVMFWWMRRRHWM